MNLTPAESLAVQELIRAADRALDYLEDATDTTGEVPDAGPGEPIRNRLAVALANVEGLRR